MVLREGVAWPAGYTAGASIFRRVPAAVLKPHTVEEIWDGIDVAKVRGWSVVGRGGGTSVAGNAIGDGVVIDTSRYFNRSLEIDVQGRTVTIEPGVIADGFSCRTQIEQGTGSDAKHIAELVRGILDDATYYD